MGDGWHGRGGGCAHRGGRGRRGACMLCVRRAVPGALGASLCACARVSRRDDASSLVRWVSHTQAGRVSPVRRATTHTESRAEGRAPERRAGRRCGGGEHSPPELKGQRRPEGARKV